MDVVVAVLVDGYSVDRRRRHQKILWTIGWVLESPRFGSYENLLEDFERDEYESYRKFTQCAPELFQIFLQRITSHIHRIPESPRLSDVQISGLWKCMLLAISQHDLRSC